MLHVDVSSSLADFKLMVLSRTLQVDVLLSLAGFKLLMYVFGVVPGTVSQGVELMCCPLLQASSY